MDLYGGRIWDYEDLPKKSREKIKWHPQTFQIVAVALAAILFAPISPLAKGIRQVKADMGLSEKVADAEKLNVAYDAWAERMDKISRAEKELRFSQVCEDIQWLEREIAYSRKQIKWFGKRAQVTYVEAYSLKDAKFSRRITERAERGTLMHQDILDELEPQLEDAVLVRKALEKELGL